SGEKSERVGIEEESESVELTPELTPELTLDDDEDGPEFNYYEKGNDVNIWD
ncbi:8596_t:CDS:1, partial [Racocetra persica]